MRRPRVAIDATVLAAAVGIEARLKIKVRAVVAADDGLAVVFEKLRFRQNIVIGIPACRVGTG